MQDVLRDEEFIPWGGPQKTVDEKWNTGSREGHWYGASTEFAKESLGDGAGRSCLVIGSPLTEADALTALGWKITYLDVRRPAVLRWKFVQCDATAISFPDESFDAVSSSCVLTHVGTGRYGDGNNRRHGDEIALAHIARVLKKAGAAALTFGACADRGKMVRLGSLHRIYTIGECQRMLAAAGLTISAMKIWSAQNKRWLSADETPTESIDSPDYISFKVIK